MSRHFTAAACAVWTAALFSWAAGARAQERDPAAAQALFDQARTLMNAQRYTEACPKLAESLRLDPGIGTQFNLADCQEHEGKLASAWAVFLEVQSLATASGQTARAQAAGRRAALLEPRLPRLRINVPSAARAPGLEITRDGVVVGEAQWETPLPLDPGEHRIEVTAPGRRAFARAVSVGEGATVAFDVPPLEPAAGAAAPGAPTPTALGASPSPAPPPDPIAPPRQPEPAAPSSGPSGLVIGLGIGGLVLVGTGTALAFVAMGKHEDSKAQCRPDDENLCGATGVSLRDDARLMGNFATAGFVAGGAAIAVAAVLWMLDDGDESANVAVSTLRVGASPHGASIAWRGAL